MAAKSTMRRAKAARAETRGERVVCIICGHEKPGIRIKEDNVIRSVKWIKRNVTRSEKNNTLVVCRECYPKYTKDRGKYTSRQVLYVALGIVFAIFTIVLNPAAVTVLMSIAVIALFYLLSLLNYVPELDIRRRDGGAAEAKDR